VIIGHSERREYFKETEETLAQKVNLAIQYGLVPIYCCGEKLEVREANNHFTLIEKQISEGLFHLSKDNFTKIAVAYEPVWAIGTGKVATPTQAQEMHAFIREKIESHYTKESADTTTILYGGSVKPSNALQIFENPDVDSEPKTVTAKEHRSAYGSDGDYFSKPNVEDVFEVCYKMMNGVDPNSFPQLY